MSPNPTLIKANDRTEARNAQTVINRFIELNGNANELALPHSYGSLDSEVIIRVSNAFNQIRNSESAGAVTPKEFVNGIKVCYFSRSNDSTFPEPIDFLQRYFFDPERYPGSLTLLSSEDAHRGVPGKSYVEYRLKNSELLDTNRLFDPRSGQTEYSRKGPLKAGLLAEYEQDDRYRYEFKEPLTCKEMFEVTGSDDSTYFKMSDFFREGIYMTDFIDDIYHLDDLVDASQSFKRNRYVEKDFDVEEILILRNEEGYGFLEGTVREGKTNCQLSRNVKNHDHFSQPVFLETDEGKRELILNVSFYLPKRLEENVEPLEKKAA